MNTTTRTALLKLWERCPACKPYIHSLAGADGLTTELLAEAAITRWLAESDKYPQIYRDVTPQEKRYLVRIELPKQHFFEEESILDALISCANAALDTKAKP